MRITRPASSDLDMFGSSMTHSYSEEDVLSLSLAEAEYYGFVSGASTLFGDTAGLDAEAGRGIARRRGIGRVKHIETVFFWFQQMVTGERLCGGKKITTVMLTDIYAKPVPESTMVKMVSGMNSRVREWSKQSWTQSLSNDGKQSRSPQ